MSLLDLAHRDPIDWYIVFEEVDSASWWNIFLKSGYSHVYAIRWDGFNWIKVEPRLGYVDVNILLEPDALEIVHSKSVVILHTVVWRDCTRIRVPWGFGAINCVETMKSLLGIRAPFLWTPWQLSKYLRAQHGVTIETKEIRSSERA